MATASVIKTVYKTINAILSANDVSFNDVIAYHMNFLDHSIERLKEETKLWQKDAGQRVNVFTPQPSDDLSNTSEEEEPSSNVE